MQPLAAGQKLAYRVFTVGLVPLLFALYGILRLVMRRKDATAYQASLAAKAR